MKNRAPRSSRGPDIESLLKDDRFLLLVSVQGLPEAARRIGASERTLQRGASRLGTNIRALVAEFKREAAEDLFRTGRSVSEVAWILGYARVASFRCFILDEYGTTPSALRRWLRMKGCPYATPGHSSTGLDRAEWGSFGGISCLWRQMMP